MYTESWKKAERNTIGVVAKKYVPLILIKTIGETSKINRMTAYDNQMMQFWLCHIFIWLTFHVTLSREVKSRLLDYYVALIRCNAGPSFPYVKQ